MNKCERCFSYAINPHCHGRESGVDLDLCDVCYWRKRAETTNYKTELAEAVNLIHDMSDLYNSNIADDFLLKHRSMT